MLLESGRVCFYAASCVATGYIIWLTPPYETLTAFWMLSTFLLNWMFANKSHGAGGWRDSPSASLWVISPCSSQGKQIWIYFMTNFAVCFQWTGVHIIYFSTPSFPFFSVSFLLWFSLKKTSMCYLAASDPGKKYFIMGFCRCESKKKRLRWSWMWVKMGFEIRENILKRTATRWLKINK